MSTATTICLIEAAAGLLDDESPEVRIRAEAEEETGYRLGEIRKVFEAFMSPGSITEKLHFFVAEYEPGMRVGSGGGLADEGEDIEVLELPIDQALAMVADGRIADAKTIMLLQYAALNIFGSCQSRAVPATTSSDRRKRTWARTSPCIRVKTTTLPVILGDAGSALRATSSQASPPQPRPLPP